MQLPKLPHARTPSEVQTPAATRELPESGISSPGSKQPATDQGKSETLDSFQRFIGAYDQDSRKSDASAAESRSRKGSLLKSAKAEEAQAPTEEPSSSPSPRQGEVKATEGDDGSEEEVAPEVAVILEEKRASTGLPALTPPLLLLPPDEPLPTVSLESLAPGFAGSTGTDVSTVSKEERVNTGTARLGIGFRPEQPDVTLDRSSPTEPSDEVCSPATGPETTDYSVLAGSSPAPRDNRVTLPASFVPPNGNIIPLDELNVPVPLAAKAGHEILKTSLKTEGVRVTESPSDDGIGIAIRSPEMNRRKPLSHSVSSSESQVAFTLPLAAPARNALPEISAAKGPQTVESILKSVEVAGQQQKQSVVLNFEIAGEVLIVRVEKRDDAVRAHFSCKSPEVQQLMETQWKAQQASTSAPARETALSNQGGSNNASNEGRGERRTGNRSQRDSTARSIANVAVSGSARTAADTPTPRTSKKLNTLA